MCVIPYIGVYKMTLMAQQARDGIKVIIRFFFTFLQVDGKK
jgi:hypothetical protein